MEVMWKLIVFVWLAGVPTSWTTDVDKDRPLHTMEQCQDYAAELENALGYTIESNGLNQGKPFIIDTWCVQNSPRDVKL